jgi:hypothetical protein
MGGRWSSAIPEPLGPRNCGQGDDFSAPEETEAARIAAESATNVFIFNTSVKVIACCSGGPRKGLLSHVAEQVYA